MRLGARMRDSHMLWSTDGPGPQGFKPAKGILLEMLDLCARPLEGHEDCRSSESSETPERVIKEGKNAYNQSYFRFMDLPNELRLTILKLAIFSRSRVRHDLRLEPEGQSPKICFSQIVDGNKLWSVNLYSGRAEMNIPTPIYQHSYQAITSSREYNRHSVSNPFQSATIHYLQSPTAREIYLLSMTKDEMIKMDMLCSGEKYCTAYLAEVALTLSALREINRAIRLDFIEYLLPDCIRTISQLVKAEKTELNTNLEDISVDRNLRKQGYCTPLKEMLVWTEDLQAKMAQDEARES